MAQTARPLSCSWGAARAVADASVGPACAGVPEACAAADAPRAAGTSTLATPTGPMVSGNRAGPEAASQHGTETSELTTPGRRSSPAKPEAKRWNTSERRPGGAHGMRTALRHVAPSMATCLGDNGSSARPPSLCPPLMPSETQGKRHSASGLSLMTIVTHRL